MYAIIECGGRQYRAEEGHSFSVEKLPFQVGDQIELERVLLLADGSTVHIGQPTIDGVSVLATVTEQFRGKKIFVWKYKAKNRYRHRRGHRQYYTRLRIDTIVTGAASTDAAPTRTQVVEVAVPQEQVTAPQEQDDLRKIEGIGPKIAGVLAEAGITTFAALAAADVETLGTLVSEAGISAVPDTWPQQAALAASGDWAGFEALQDELDGGRRTDEDAS